MFFFLIFRFPSLMCVLRSFREAKRKMIEICQLLWSYRSRSAENHEASFRLRTNTSSGQRILDMEFRNCRKKRAEHWDHNRKRQRQRECAHLPGPQHLPCHKKLWHSPKMKWGMSSWFRSPANMFSFGVLCITTELICAPIIINFNPSDNWRWSMQIWWMVHFNLDVSFIRRAQIEIFRAPRKKKRKSI